MKKKLWLIGALALITLFTAIVFGKKTQAKTGKELFEIKTVTIKNFSLAPWLVTEKTTPPKPVWARPLLAHCFNKCKICIGDEIQDT